MPNTMRAALLAAIALLLAPAGARASGVVLKHVISVYADDAGKGLRRPEGIACSDDGQIVVADTGNARLVTFTFKGQGVLGGRPVTDAALRTPQGVQLDLRGDVYVLDARARAILKFSAKGEPLGKVELTGLPAGAEPSVAAFKVRSGALYVLDGAAKAVHVAGATGQVTRTLPLPAGKGPFTDVAVDLAGRVFVVDPGRTTLWVAEKDGTEFKVLNDSLRESTSYPAALTIDGQNNLFAVDRNGGSVLQLGVDGLFQARHLGFGWGEGQVQYPVQVCVAADYLAVADRGNNRVQVFQVLR